MQRVSVKQSQQTSQGMRPAQHRNEEVSPALLLARRIHMEQGIEQLKAYLLAVEPFVAPNELRAISSGFGINFDSIPRPKNQVQPSSNMGGQQGSMAGRNQMQMLQMMMGMQNMMKGGGDISQIMKMMNSKR